MNLKFPRRFQPNEIDGNAGSAGTVKESRHWQRGSQKKEIAFYDRIGRDGITDQAVRVSAEKFRDVFARWNERLGGFPFLLGDTLTIIDIAWYVYAKCLRFGGYPLQRIHPNVED